jgi:hypothetical protein
MHKIWNNYDNLNITYFLWKKKDVVKLKLH